MASSRRGFSDELFADTRADRADTRAAVHTPPAAPAPAPPQPAPSPRSRQTVRAKDLGPRPYKSGGRVPAADLRNERPVRFNAYLRPDQLVRLRNEVATRQARGERMDVSILIRVAVDVAFPDEDEQVRRQTQEAAQSRRRKP